jgi:multiple sugar transport system ATP-binding protein
MGEVKISGLKKSYGGMQVIHGVEIEVKDGQFVVLVGPSGCGKSTLLRMIAGLEEISGGQITIGGRSVANLPPSERDIAMVFQNYALYPHKTVAENMSFALKMARMDKGEIEARVKRAAEILGLTSLLARYPRALSGGQRQRVAMGRAIVRNPQVFLFDEPLSNLDAKLRVQMRAEIRELHQRLKTTTIYVTHDQIEAMTMADQIVVMKDGRVSQQGSPLQLYDFPDNTFVAGFIGSPAMNLVPGTISATGDSVDFAGGRISITPRSGVTAGRKVIVGMRPEHLAISGRGFPAQVVVVEPTGSETHVVFRVDDVEMTAVFRERHAFKPGESVQLTVDPQLVHLFDAETTLRLQ